MTRRLATSNPRLSEQQYAVLMWIEETGGERGVTVKDLRDHAGCHHGQASGVLSRLHHRGLISCLRDKRGEYHVYVANKYVNERATVEPGQLRPGGDMARFEAFIAGYHAANGTEPDVWDKVTLRPAFEQWLATSKD